MTSDWIVDAISTSVATPEPRTEHPTQAAAEAHAAHLIRNRRASRVLVWERTTTEEQP